MKETDQSTQSSCRRKSSRTNGGGGVQRATEAPAHVVSPFTSGQWAELEHQALIFKYMVAGLNVPEELLNPIRRSVASALINGMSTATQHTAAANRVICSPP
ncbi:unnamed protein product [Sphagnum jensenii]|uniref:Growth-regulating factor n=1 Tax=Sphagnum jensenii TaxID=128206 RepID=A0ABP1BX35_9BRYO